MNRKCATVLGILILLLLGAGIAWLIHARSVAAINECIYNLQCIDGAKRQWAFEKFADSNTNRPWNTDYSAQLNAVPTEKDVRQYNSRNQNPMPRCPQGGKYSIGRVADLPTCSYPDHLMPETDFIPGFVYVVLIDVYHANATELAIGVPKEQDGDAPLRCKVEGTWRETRIPSYLRPRIIAEVQRLAGLPQSQFPCKGTFIVRLESKQFKWMVQVESAEADCILTPVHE